MSDFKFGFKSWQCFYSLCPKYVLGQFFRSHLGSGQAGSMAKASGMKSY